MSTPVIPTRDYSTLPPPPPPVYAPNTTVPNFIRMLSFVVFVLGGSSAALITILYKNLIFPRLALTTEALTNLQRTQLKLFSQLSKAVASLVLSKGNKVIAPELTEKAEGIVAREDSEIVEESKLEITLPISTPIPTKPILETDTETLAEPEAIITTAPPQIFLDLSKSLLSLSSAFPPPAPITSLFAATQFPAHTTAPLTKQESLTKSLTTLNDYLEAETFISASSAYRNYTSNSNNFNGMTGDGTGKDQKALFEAVANFKLEIRAVKGALLNRRNFTSRTEVA